MNKKISKITEEKQYEKVIIFALQGLGDFIINIPLIKELTKQEIKLTIVVSNNGSSQIAKVLLKNKNIHVIIWNEYFSSFRNIFNIQISLAYKKFNRAYALYPSGKRENVLLYLIRANKKFICPIPKGFISLLQFLNENHSIKIDSKKHCFETNAELLSIEPEKKAYQKIVKHKKNKHLKIGLHIGAGNQDREWEVSNFLKLINLLEEKHEIKLFLFAGKKEADKTRKLRKTINLNSNLYVDHEFDKLIDIISDLDLYIGNDSGFTHLCSHLGVKTVTIWSYANFYKTSAYNINNFIIKYDDRCHEKYDLSVKKNKVCKCVNCISPSIVESIVTRIISDKDFIGFPFIKKLETLKSGGTVIYVD